LNSKRLRIRGKSLRTAIDKALDRVEAAAQRAPDPIAAIAQASAAGPRTPPTLLANNHFSEPLIRY